jgi:hypothetical protein
VRRARPLLAALAVLALAPTHARANPSATLRVRFTPYRLGHTTNLSFNLNIAAPSGQIPPPLVGVDVLYPQSLGLDVSGLGITTCKQALLEELGPNGCPAESLMGYGIATAELRIGPETITETAHISIIRAPEGEGHIAMYLNAIANTPVVTELILDGLQLPGPAPYEHIHITVPLIPAVPGAPDVSVVRIDTTFGPEGLTYYEKTHGTFVPYQPQGILLPRHCPQGGFPFIAKLAFADGTNTSTATHIRCPGQLRSPTTPTRAAGARRASQLG